MWAARTTELNRNQMGTPDWYNEMRAGYEDQIAENDAAEKYTSFVFDQSSIETQVANVLNVQQQYWWPMELGFTDYNTAYDEYCKKMEAAGLQDIVDEAQRQLDEYVKTLE
jgi:putative aldouronate transport system substrate-binding protein